MNNQKKKLLKIGIAALAIAAIIYLLPLQKNKPIEKTYNEFLTSVNQEQVEKVEYDSTNQVFYYYLENDNTKYQTSNPRDPEFKKNLLEKDIEVKEIKIGDQIGSIVFSMALLFMQYSILFGLMFFIYQKIQGKAKFEFETSHTTFADVAGLEEIKENLTTTVDMMKNRQKYTKAGARLPSGTLLYGPPGTGKTLLAKAVAGEAKMNFIAVNGAEFDNKFVGVGADKVRTLFETARKNAPCIVFIDEIDAIACQRREGSGSYERQTLNQLLSCMDGFTEKDDIYVFAATNDLNSLDHAILRPGRFDERIAVPLPETAADREEIIRLYLKNKKVANDVSVETLSKQTLGCSPATIEAIINDAAIAAAKHDGIISMADIDNAYYKQLMNGHQKKQYERNEDEIQTVAWHEAGHAIIGYILGTEVTKISIIPSTSGAGGITIFNPKQFGLFSKEELEKQICTLYGGRCAELILNGDDYVTTGASNDITKATSLIKNMVTKYGMSSLGLLDMSEMSGMNSKVYEECKIISDKISNDALSLLRKNINLLKELSALLIEKESLNKSEIIQFFECHNIIQ